MCCQPASLTFIRLQIASQITLKDRGTEGVGASGRDEKRKGVKKLVPSLYVSLFGEEK